MGSQLSIPRRGRLRSSAPGPLVCRTPLLQVLAARVTGAVARMASALLVRVFEGWAELAQEELEKTRKIRLLAARIQRGLEVRVLTAWHGYVEDAREALAIALCS